ncbi:TonB-linked outer membrane protein, SusC/RagA family [Mucilaginibacter mallensis]|uniref:TonB-linked outer membrane protein, SusC/RagA family n=1 Tax=Mucilaginibacter mallensis TaxID=652787 RepID=A0A1H1Y2G6_MUCMA|nr:TonB-dependent receptor [Mucilaginibacter mallensis]SDT15409.1 TonB-linked outer membrane protein, SusC/RagA family [Mucilaginibacter mallensis]
MEKLKLMKCWKTMFILLCMSLISVPIFAQSSTVTGKVIDEKGETIIGATVKLKSHPSATSTGPNGKFSISVPAGENALVISFIGYNTQEVHITPQSNNLKITLIANANSLNEVVVVGYGTQKKRDVTGAISTISQEALAAVPSDNVIDQLKGRLAGVDIVSNSTQPGASNQIRIRGERSLGGTQSQADAQNQPLIIVDGVPFIGGTMNDINPNDISSLDVLKDASATAIYGSRASGGVILITTKRGKAGKSVMTYNAYYGISHITDEYPVFSGSEYAAFKAEAAAGNTVNPGTTAYGLTSAEQAGIANGTSTNWQNLIFRSGYTTDQLLGLTGGNEDTQYGLSAGYHKDEGTVYGQSFERYTLRTTIDHKINNRLRVGLNSLENVSNTNGANLYPLYNTISLSPLTSPYNADGSVNLLPLAGSIDAAKVNPLTIQNPAIQNLSRRLSTFNSLYGEVQILDGLKYRANVGLTYGQTQGNNYLPVSNLYNTATATSQTSESVANEQDYSYLLENLLTYDKTFGKHHLTVTGLYSVEKDHSDGSTFNGVGLPADYIQSYNLNLANSVSASNGTYSEKGLISYMARVNYSFNDRYLLTATVRRDGSSVLTSGHQYLTYPAFALGWNADREDFLKDVSWVSNLKLRAGYGVTSNQSVAPYSTLGNLTINAYNFGTNGYNGYLVTSVPANLKFETTDNFNIGLDFSVLHNRISGSIDAYDQRTNNILQTISLPPSNGAGSTLVNAGKTKGKGLEISLSSVNIRTESGFTWNTDFNISFYRDAIVALHDNLKEDVGNGWFVGQPFNVIYDYKKIGIWQTSQAAEAAKYGEKPGQIEVQDVNNDGKIDQNDRQILGSYQPKFESGLTNRFSFMGIDVTFVAFARIGQMVAVPYLGSDSGASGYPFFNTGRVNQYKVDYWTPSNPTNAFPRPDASGTFLYASTLQYRDGSFIKMRSINVGYTIPSDLLKKAGISSLRVYATCSNPFIIWSPLTKSGLGIDPEGNGYGGTLAGPSGYSSGAIGRAITVGLNDPPTRTFQLGVNLKF